MTLNFFLDKPLLMLQSIKRAFATDPEHPKLHECIIRFAKTSRHPFTSACFFVVEAWALVLHALDF